MMPRSYHQVTGARDAASPSLSSDPAGEGVVDRQT